MSVYIKRNIDDNAILGIWKIEETFNWYITQVQLNNNGLQAVPGVRNKSEQRKLHWLSTQLLLRDLLNSKKRVEIIYDQNGKPHLSDSTYKISISHSNKFVAIQLSKAYAGVDIQQITQKIERIAEKFMNLKELNSLKTNDPTCLTGRQVEQLHVFWGAKEALYKLYGKRALHFKENLLIEPFAYKEQGVINGCISTSKMKQPYSLYYEKIEEYMLVYVLKQINE